MIRTLVLAFIASAVALGAERAWAEGPPTPPPARDKAAQTAAAKAPEAPAAAAQSGTAPVKTAAPAAQPAGAAPSAESAPAADTAQPEASTERAPAPGDGSIPGYVAGTDLFYGRVNSMPSKGFVGDWSVAGRIVRVSDQTKVEEQGEPIKVGIRVEVIGVYRDGTFDAMIVRNRRR